MAVISSQEHWNYSIFNTSVQCESCQSPFGRISRFICGHNVCDPCRSRSPCPLCMFGFPKVRPISLEDPGYIARIIPVVPNQIINRKAVLMLETEMIFANFGLQIDARKKCLLDNAIKIYNSKLEAIHRDQISIEKLWQQFILEICFFKENKDSFDNETKFKMYLKLLEKCEILRNKRFLLKEDGNINFNPYLASLAKSNISNFLFVFSDPCARYTVASGYGTEYVLLGKKTYFTVTCFDHLRQNCQCGGDDIKATLTYRGRSSDESIVDLQIIDLKAGLYKGIIKTNRNERPVLRITLRGCPIQTTDFPLKIGNFRFSSNIQIQSINLANIRKVITGTPQGGFSKKCWGLCVNSDGDIYVADKENCCIFIFNYRFEFVMKFGKPGQGNGEFIRPTGICIDKSEILYVVDKDNHRVQVFTKDGRFINKFGKRGTENGEFEFPWDVASNSRYVVVSDSNNCRVQLFNKQGVFLISHKIGTYKTSQTPRGLYFYDENTVVASYFDSNSVFHLRITNDTNKLKMYHDDLKLGNVQGQGLLERPQGIFHYENTLFVTAAKREHILVYQRRGNNRYAPYDRVNVIEMDRWALRRLNLRAFNPCNVRMMPDGKLLILHSKNENPGDTPNEVGSCLLCIDPFPPQF